MAADFTTRPDVIVAERDLPTFTRPRFASLRIRLAELTFADDKAARLRWAVRNADEPQVCGCGRPAAVMVRDGYQIPRLTGPVFYRCEVHRNVPLTAPGLPEGQRECVKGCGWVAYDSEMYDERTPYSSGGPTATRQCEHEWGPFRAY